MTYDISHTSTQLHSSEMTYSRFMVVLQLVSPTVSTLQQGEVFWSISPTLPTMADPACVASSMSTSACASFPEQEDPAAVGVWVCVCMSSALDITHAALLSVHAPPLFLSILRTPGSSSAPGQNPLSVNLFCQFLPDGI